MSDLWPAWCTAAALAVLLVLIIRYKVHAFAALLAVSLGLGLAAGMGPGQVVDSISKGVGDILRDVAVILALGAMLGRMLEVSGAAQTIARTLIDAFGVRHAPLAILCAGFLIGIPVLFNVGFLLLMPIMWRLQRQTGRSLLYYMLPLAFSLGLTHSLVPPHPGIVGAVNALGGSDPGGTMVQTILFGSLMCIPLMLLGWLGPGRFWASRQHVEAPQALAGTAVPLDNNLPADEPPAGRRGDFPLAILIVTLPLLLSLAGFGAKLGQDLELWPTWMAEPLLPADDVPVGLLWLAHSPLAWLQFLGKPTVALLVPTGLAFWLLGLRRGLRGPRLAKVADDALRDVGSMVFLFGAAGGLKEVIQATGAGSLIARQMIGLPLSPVVVCFLVAALMRIALGSATASILTASALLANFAAQLPGQEALLVLAVANGVTFMTQPADSGFWMVKELGNLSERDVLLRFNACRIPMSLTGLLMLAAVEALVY